MDDCFPLVSQIAFYIPGSRNFYMPFIKHKISTKSSIQLSISRQSDPFSLGLMDRAAFLPTSNAISQQSGLL